MLLSLVGIGNHDQYDRSCRFSTGDVRARTEGQKWRVIIAQSRSRRGAIPLRERTRVLEVVAMFCRKLCIIFERYLSQICTSHMILLFSCL